MSVFRASSLFPPLFYEFGPRSIETGCQRLSLLVASPKGSTPEPQLRRLPVTQTSPQGQPPLAHRRARDSSRGCGEKSAFKIPSMLPLLSSPLCTFFLLSLRPDHGVGHPICFVLPHSSSRRAVGRRRYLGGVIAYRKPPEVRIG